MPDDLSHLEDEFRKRIANHFHGDNLEKRNPYRVSDIVREQQKEWLPTRRMLNSARGTCEGFAFYGAMVGMMFLIIGLCEWAEGTLRPRAVIILTLGGPAMGWLYRKLSAKAGMLQEYINGKDRLYQLPLRCDECDKEYFEPAKKRCGKCECCPRCEAPYDPPSRIEQCTGCKMDRAG